MSFQRTRIKFCGVMRPEDAAAASSAGADAVGLIFVGGAGRCVSIEQGQAIVQQVGPFVTPVAVFADSGVDEIRRVTSALQITTVQLHGDETPAIVEALRPLRVIKTIRGSSGSIFKNVFGWIRSAHLTGLLFDTAGPGGTGIENNWDELAEALAEIDRRTLPPIIAAGGLTPENVEQVVRRIKPWAVDVSSGIENAPGLKSMEKMTAFAAAVRQGEI